MRAGAGACCSGTYPYLASVQRGPESARIVELASGFCKCMLKTLTHKAPPIICSGRQFQILRLFRK